MDKISFTVYGQLFSKSNSRQLVRNKRTGQLMSIKSANARRCTKHYIAQMEKIWQGKSPITNEIKFIATIYYPSHRQDADESLLMDCLQKSGIIKNDRQIKQKMIDIKIDKSNPRCEITLGGIDKKGGENLY